MTSPDRFLNAPLRIDGNGEWQDWLVDETESQETRLAEREELGQHQKLLLEAMKTLNDRERHILTERRLKDEPKTLEDLSRKYGISPERVRQIEMRVFAKLQKLLHPAVACEAKGPVRRRSDNQGATIGETDCGKIPGDAAEVVSKIIEKFQPTKRWDIISGFATIALGPPVGLLLIGFASFRLAAALLEFQIRTLPTA